MLDKFKTISNPLTIIALFAGLAEISGTIVLPLLSTETQEIYVWFLMVFPLTLILLFFFTLNKNHKVLYAPSDYENDESFLKVLDKKIWEAEKTIEATVGESLQLNLDKSMRAHSLVRNGMDFLNKKNYTTAIETFKEALELFPENSDAKVGMANAINYMNEKNHELPVKLITEALESNGKNPYALYNRACIKSLNIKNYGLQSVIEDLKKAIDLNEGYREMSVTDEDFKAIWDEQEFKMATGQA